MEIREFNQQHRKGLGTVSLLGKMQKSHAKSSPQKSEGSMFFGSRKQWLHLLDDRVKSKPYKVKDPKILVS